MAAAALATEGLGVLTPMGALTRAGGAAEAATVRGLAAAGVEGATARVLPKVARGVVEGMGVGAGSYTSEAALGNHEMRAEELLAAAAGGGLIGGGFGLALGLGGEAVRGIRGLAQKETGPALGAELSEAPAGKPSFGSREWAQEKSLEKGFEATGAPIARVDALKEGVPGLHGQEYQNTARNIVFKEAPAAISEKEGKILLPKQQAEAYEKLLRSYDDKLEGIYSILDGKRSEAIQTFIKKNGQDVYNQIEHQIPGTIKIEPIVNNIRGLVEHEFGAVADKQESQFLLRFAKDLEKAHGKEASLAMAHREQVSIEEALMKASNAGNERKAEALQQVSAFLDDEIAKATKATTRQTVALAGEAGNMAFEDLPTSVSRALNELRSKRHIASNLLAAAKLGSKYRPSPFGNLEGALTGSILGNIWNPVAGAAAGLGMIGLRYAKQYATPALAQGLNAYAEHGIGMGIIKTAEATNKEITSGIRGFLSGGKSLPTAARAATVTRLNPASYAELRYTLAKRKDDPSILADEIAATGIHQTHPTIAKTLYQRAQTLNDHLLGVLPQQFEVPSLTGPVPVPPTDHELRAVQKRLEILSNPMQVFEHLRNGTITPEIVTDLQKCYPALFSEVKQQIVLETSAKVSSKTGKKEKSDIPYDKKISLGFLFGTPVDPTMSPDYLMAMRVQHDQSSGSQRQNKENTAIPTSSQLRAIKSVPSKQTRTERIASR
jgi:hypothetical protein